MTQAREAIQQAVREFLAAEFPDGLPATATPPVLAAVGRTAAIGLDNPLLRRPLEEAGLRLGGTLPLADPEALLADRTWALALVLSPFKRDLPRLCTGLTPLAEATGVVDTVLRSSEQIIGVNTNAYAAAAAVRHLVGDMPPERVLVAGTGATARSVLVALHRLYPDRAPGLIGRSPERVAELVRDFGRVTPVDDAARYQPDLIIHTTSVGERDDTDVLGFDLAGAFSPGVRLFDLPNRVSALQQAALAAGCIAMPGRFMQLIINTMRVALLAR